jgi:hypothetical protein
VFNLNFFRLTKTDYSLRETPYIPKDDLLASLLIQIPDQVFKYHEHDSLLANKPEQDLSEEEKKEAWTIYETEISTKAPIFNVVSMHGLYCINFDFVFAHYYSVLTLLAFCSYIFNFVSFFFIYFFNQKSKPTFGGLPHMGGDLEGYIHKKY